MSNKIHKETVSDLLLVILNLLMNLEALKNFRLVGDTSLSLMIGHRSSVDIDMFSDAEYGSIDFQKIHKSLKKEFFL